MVAVAITNNNQIPEHQSVTVEDDSRRMSPIIIDTTTDDDSSDDLDVDLDIDPDLTRDRGSDPSSIIVTTTTPPRPINIRPRTRTITYSSHIHQSHRNQNYTGNYNFNNNNYIRNFKKPNFNYSNLNSKSLSLPSKGDDSSFKEVVVIGNGPSGIVLSYFLAGHWPYYNGQGESVHEMLHYRLLAEEKRNHNKKGQQSYYNKNNNNNNNKSLVEMDLEFLSQGLEGRSTNPVALLFDSLNHPQADLGLELPSLLNWQVKGPVDKIDHVVIGKGPPGGAWQSMDGNVLTISLGCWMELPEMNFREWEAEQATRCCRESRASVASVAQYYCDYVRKHGLDEYFLCDSVVTKVERFNPGQKPSNDAADLHWGEMEIDGNDSSSSSSSDSNRLPLVCDNNYLEYQYDANMELETCVEGKKKAEHPDRISRRHTISEIPLTHPRTNPTFPTRWNRPLWKVKGYRRVPQKSPEDPNSVVSNSTLIQPFTYITPNLVLATGASDKPNVLNVPGEDLPYVLHCLNDLEHLIETGELNRDSDPVLIVGAGLSAADAIIAARFHSVPVIHVFRRSVRDPDLIFRQLPENMYPEYHKVYQMMQDPVGYDNYTAYAEHVVTKIRPDGKVLLSGPISCGSVKVSYVAICIGNQPDLSFLGEEIESTLGVHHGLPIDCKRNPVSIDFNSHQSTRHPGLYALGPVVGENFVRFLQGGALAVTDHLVKERRKEETSLPPPVQSIHHSNL